MFDDLKDLFQPKWFCVTISLCQTVSSNIDGVTHMYVKQQESLSVDHQSSYLGEKGLPAGGNHCNIITSSDFTGSTSDLPLLISFM